MTMDSLLATLEKATSNGALVLTKDTLPSKQVEGLFDQVLTAESLEIRSVDISTTEGGLVVTGRASLFAVADAPVTLSFSVDEKDEQTTRLVIRVTLPREWTFSQSFPDLKNGPLTRLGMAEEGFLLDRLGLGEPTLVLDSDDANDEDGAPRMGFEGKLRSDHPLLPVQRWFKDPAPLPVRGSITRTDRGTEVFLNTPIVGEVDLDYLRVPRLELDLVADAIAGAPTKDGDAGEGDAYTHAYFALETTLQFGDGQEGFTLPVYGTFRSAHQELTLEADLEGLSPIALSQLDALVRGTPLSDALPDGFHLGDALVLSRLALTFTPQTLQLRSIDLTVKAARAWPLAGKLSMDQVAARFLVTDPADAEARTVSCDLSGEFAIDKLARLQVGATFPDFVLWGHMRAQDRLPLSRLFETFTSGATALPGGFPDVVFSELGVTFDPGDGSFTIGGVADADWEVVPDLLRLEQVRATLGVDHHAGGATTGTVRGTLRIAGAEAVLQGDLADDLVLKGTLPDLRLSAIAQAFLGGDKLPREVPDLEWTDLEVMVSPGTGEFAVSGRSASSWRIPVGVGGLEVSDVTLEVMRSADASGVDGDDTAPAVSGLISGSVALGATRLEVEYRFPGSLVLSGQVPSVRLSALVDALCGDDAFTTLSMPASVAALSVSDVEVEIAPQQESLSLAADSSLGHVDLVIRKTGPRWGFAAAFTPPPSWRFSELADELSALDVLVLSRSAFVLASADGIEVALPDALSGRGDVTPSRGLNFFASIDLTGLGVDALLGITAIDVRAAVGRKPSDLVLEAAIAGSFDLGEGVAFGDITFRLRPRPGDFALTLMGTVTATLDGSALAFVGGMEVKPRAAEFQATMVGLWKDPFGARGVMVQNVALELGMTFPPPFPTVGVVGTLQVGEFAGAVAVKFDSAVPSRSMLAVAFNRLHFKDVLATFCAPEVARSIPASLTRTVLDIGLEDVDLYVVPQETTIGELRFEQGTRLRGTVRVWGLRAFGDLRIEEADGIELTGTIDAINLAGLFKLSGAGGEPKPAIHLQVGPRSAPGLELRGTAELLGIRQEAQILVSDEGLSFTAHGKIFNLFDCALHVRGKDLAKGGDLLVRAEMRNDLTEYLRKEATKALQVATDAATKELTEAQAAVASAQRQVDKLDGDIRDMRATIQRERDRDAKRMRDAQAAVQRAQDEVNKLNRDIDNMRKTIQRERDRDSKRMRDAQAALGKAQNEVNSIQREIDSTKRRINQLNKDIKNKKRWLDKSPWYKQTYRAPEYAAYAAAKGTEIGALYTKIGTLEAAKGAAIGVLEGAKQVVRGLEKAIDTFPIDADVRMAGLYAARETANVALEGAKQVVRGLELTIDSFPIDADVRIAGLFTAKESATAALYVATQTLEGVKISVGALAEVGQFIVEHGLGGLLDVKAARFEATLGAAKGGSVSLDLDVVFMKGKPRTLDVSFSFHDPLSGAQELALQLLPT